MWCPPSPVKNCSGTCSVWMHLHMHKSDFRIMIRQHKCSKKILVRGINRKSICGLQLWTDEIEKNCNVLVEGDNKSYCFAHVLLLFHLTIAGLTSQGEKYAFAHHFDVLELIDEVDIVINCLFKVRNGNWYGPHSNLQSQVLSHC